MRLKLQAMTIVAVLGWSIAAHAASWSDDKARRAGDMLQTFLRPKPSTPIRPPGITIAIGLDGTLVYAGGAGTAGLGRPAAAETVYRIGSLTKQFTAAAVLRMIEQAARSPRTGQPLSLETEIGDVFDGTDEWHVDGQNPITLRTLLNMTSNLPNFTRRPPEDVDPWGTVHAATLLNRLKRQKPSGWPGTFEYSNTSYFILAEALEAARWPDSQPHAYEQVLHTELFGPLGMTSTDFTGYRLDRMAIPSYNRRAAFSNRDWLKGSGDCASTVEDMFRWNAALMSGRVLSAPMRAEMFREGGRVTPKMYYGMGWFMEEQDGWTNYFHTGAVPGFTSFNGITTRKDSGSWISVTLLTNADGVEGIEELANALTDLVIRD